jgi:hypothetical protein
LLDVGYGSFADPKRPTDAFRLPRWLAGSRVDGEDIVQEAAIRAF